MKKKGRVFVGMSGGVDSSVSAALLCRAGFEVVGVFIRVWEPPGIPCTWREDRREAMRVAARLEIPLITLDLEEEYKCDVVDYMIREYRVGRTPNPDVMCNKRIKFGAFYTWAMKQGADYVATGHYAQIVDLDGQPALLRGRDSNKDQSYFLWTLRPEQLTRTLFPIGHLSKPEVRQQAKKLKLPNAEKPDSQGLCFMGRVDVKDFLSKYIELKPGAVLDEGGREIGVHAGALLYTIGERHGFEIKQAPREMPYFVVSRDMAANTLTVSQNPPWRNQDNILPEIVLEEINWISAIPLARQVYQARIRHRGELYPAGVIVTGHSTIIKFEKMPMAIAPGQSLVVYDGEQVVGGGVIKV